ncbi:Crp/Fnr family transcriptional regulator [Paenibacillus validus]|uniref:Crp/Fnr family transcriptional regulator n=1 Tax=Paenibacillus validus TaxID=44253 RepID=UPI000FDB1826|nr:Crp/Fnr family transcriptional regulator [Paenibacillus validus]MED4603524.1 Crp/Fnr family transcriptional regulator [Paenibacillus validus]MED4605347.1 Crp/Fnr family transcriptional regulator [Paenibacillus validus]
MSKLISLLRHVPLFQDLSAAELETIAPLFVERKYKKGTILFFEGDAGEEFFLIQSGVVKVYRIDNAKEIILSLFRGGDFFGEMSLIQTGLQRSATAETMDNCSIYTLVRSEFYHFMERTPKLCLRLLEVTMERLRKTNEQIYDLTFLDVRSRIIKTIFRLSEQYGQPKTNGTFINMKLTHQQLANMVGTVRESVTKVLQELQEDHIITIDKKFIFVRDVEGLKKMIH